MMTATFQVDVVQFLLYFGIITGTLLFCLFIFRWRQFQGSLWLSLLVLTLPLNFLNYTIIPIVYRKWECFTLVRIPVLYGFGLLFFLYMKSILRRSTSWEKKHLWYALPFLLDVLYSFTQAIYIRFWDVANKGEWFYWQIEFLIHEGFALAYNIALVLAAYRLVRKSERPVNDSDIGRYKWAKRISMANLVVLVTWLVYYVTEWLVYPEWISFQQYYPLWVVEIVLILTIGYKSILQPKIAFRLKEPIPSPAPKYLHSSLGDAELRALGEKLVKWVEEEEAFLNPQLKLADLSQGLGVSPPVLSQVFSQALQVNFYDFTNGYRVEKVKQFLEDANKKNHTILSLAFEAGFNSKTAFNVAFKKFTGTSPSAYRKKKLAPLSMTAIKRNRHGS